MDSLKGLLKSKVFYFNVLTGVVELSQLLPPGTGVLVGTVGNILLRFVTNTPLSQK
jgi:hypothetical protein